MTGVFPPCPPRLLLLSNGLLSGFNSFFQSTVLLLQSTVPLLQSTVPLLQSTVPLLQSTVPLVKHCSSWRSTSTVD